MVLEEPPPSRLFPPPLKLYATLWNAGGPAGGPGFGGRVGLLALGAGVTPHVVHTPYDHASLLRTTEDALGIAEHLGNASRSAAMRDLFER